MPTFLLGLQRVLNCSKVHLAVTGLVSTYFAVRYAATDLPAPERSALWVAFIGAVAVQLREIINAWTEEDVAMVNKRAEVSLRRAQSSRGQRAENASETAGLASDPALPRVNPQIIFPRNPVMPLRTKLPLVLIAFAMITLLGGCQSCPELAVYREGLSKVDEPLYQAHLLLLDDAVKAGVRSDADREVVRQGINAARALYHQASDPAAAPKP